MAIMKKPKHILPVIVLAQFAGTSLWFAGNAILESLQSSFGLPESALSGLTSAVQLGFIAGTLLYAALLLADRFSPSQVFLASAVLGAGCNIAVGTVASTYEGMLAARFLTGFFLAGIYPVGMKIAADWYEGGLGKALGYLVGALVLGTAFPHFLSYTSAGIGWQPVLLATSGLAVAGGLSIWWLVPDGPFRKPARSFRPGAIIAAFRQPGVRSAALGYFGHMWELYAFWAFLPVVLKYRFHSWSAAELSLSAFLLIGAGSAGCIWGGYQALRSGSAVVARGMLLASGLLCLLSPLLFLLPAGLSLLFLAAWGFSVVGDSPQCSALVAKHTPAESRGSVLTLVNCIGFAVTIGSLQLLGALAQWGDTVYLMLPLAAGPVIGLWGLSGGLQKSAARKRSGSRIS